MRLGNQGGAANRRRAGQSDDSNNTRFKVPVQLMRQRLLQPAGRFRRPSQDLVLGSTMHPSKVFAILLLTTSLVTVTSLSTHAEEARAATAAEATAGFFAALAANDVDYAIAMTAPVKGVPPESVRKYYERIAEHFKTTGTPEVVAHLQLKDTAIVVFREYGAGKRNVIDLDPAYLVRREAKRLVLFKVTRFDAPHVQLDESVLVNLNKLKEWLNAQKPALKAILASGT